MPRFFTTDISDKKVRIIGEDAEHISKSLRMRVSERIDVCDMNGYDYHCVLSEVSKELVIADIIEKTESKSELSVRISLYQALPKSGKLENIAQKAVELGVYEIIPVLTSRCVSRWDKKDAPKKLDRLQKIMTEAAKQSGRGMIPRILPLCGFEDAITRMKGSDLAILFYECADAPLSGLLNPAFGTVSVMTGSEGGFSKEEADRAKIEGLSLASLGARILRCETAPICAISAISFAAGEF